MIKRLAIANLCLCAILLSTAVVNSWTHGSIAQSVLSSLNIIATNPNINNNLSDLAGSGATCTYDYNATWSLGFVDLNCAEININQRIGQNVYAGGTNAKVTSLGLNVVGNYYGAGQHVLHSDTATCVGQSDCGAYGQNVTYAAGPIAGDEGQALQLYSHLTQQPNLDLGTVTSVPTPTTCNTTITQSVTGGPTPQAVSVASTTNCNVNDWTVIQQQIASGQGTPNAEAVQITAVGGGKISGVFRNSHPTSTTVTPALLLGVDNAGIGQNRVFVNLSQPSYSTGTIASISGAAGLVGSGTSWANNMVGGSATNVGCVAMTADQYTGAPFNGSAGTSSGPLNSWYQIEQVVSGTLMAIFSFSTAGDVSYHGNGPGSGGYVVRPCVEVLYMVNSLVICESTSTTWSVNDKYEQAIVPYPSVTGFNYTFAKYNPGGVNQVWYNVLNTGARTMQTGISLGSDMATGSNADTLAWGNGYFVSNADVGFSCLNCNTAALSLGSVGGSGDLSDNSGKILWRSFGPYIMPNSTNHGIDFHFIENVGLANTGTLSSKDYSVVGSGQVPTLQFTGVLGTSATIFSNLPTCASGLEGLEMAITDGSTSTFNATVAGSGSNHVKAYCNGANWTVH